jgi:sugar/nucleoside kinase (ribokinase family)
MAFDNLQWDFDLSDVAQQTDAVVFGALARRSGQTRSTIDRFLAECTAAMKIFDLTGGHRLERATALPALRSVDAAVADLRAIRALVPGAADAVPRDATLQLIRSTNISFVLLVGDGTPTVHTMQAAHEGHTALEPGQHEATVAALAHGVLSGWNLDEALRLADRFARHRRDHPDEPAPTSMVVTTGG